MARQEQLVNNGASTLSSGISNSVTSLSVDSATGFPTEGNFRIIIGTEILEVTAVSGSTFTVVRGTEGTTAASHSASDPVTAIVTETSLEKFFRDRDPWSTTRPPFRIVDTNGDYLDSTDFTQVNYTDNAASSDDDGNITISKDDHASNSISALVRSAPSTPYTIVSAVGLNLLGDASTNGPIAGPCFRETSSGEIIINSLQPCFSRSQRIIHYTSPTGTATVIAEAEPQLYAGLIWHRMEDDGTDLTWDWSLDGVNWQFLWTEARGTRFTTGPDQIGFCINNLNGVDGGAITLLAWDGE